MLNWVRLNLTQFSGCFKKWYADKYTIKKSGVSDEREEADI
jgi:hypothetical protein